MRNSFFILWEILHPSASICSSSSASSSSSTSFSFSPPVPRLPVGNKLFQELGFRQTDGVYLMAKGQLEGKISAAFSAEDHQRRNVIQMQHDKEIDTQVQCSSCSMALGMSDSLSGRMSRTLRKCSICCCCMARGCRIFFGSMTHNSNIFGSRIHHSIIL